MATSVLDLTCTAAVALEAGRVVVRSGAHGAALPAASGNTPETIIGVTLASQARIGASVPIRRIGIADIEASEAISAGNPVVISGDDGRVGALAWPSVLLAATSPNTGLRLRARFADPALEGFVVTLIDGTADQALSVGYQPGKLDVFLETDSGGAATTTIAELKTALEASAAAPLFDFTAVGTTTLVIVADAFTLSGFAAAASAIGIAQSDASATGEMIPVLLTL